MIEKEQLEALGFYQGINNESYFSAKLEKVDGFFPFSVDHLGGTLKDGIFKLTQVPRNFEYIGDLKDLIRLIGFKIKIDPSTIPVKIWITNILHNRWEDPESFFIGAGPHPWLSDFDTHWVVKNPIYEIIEDRKKLTALLMEEIIEVPVNLLKKHFKKHDGVIIRKPVRR